MQNRSYPFALNSSYDCEWLIISRTGHITHPQGRFGGVSPFLGLVFGANNYLPSTFPLYIPKGCFGSMAYRLKRPLKRGSLALQDPEDTGML